MTKEELWSNRTLARREIQDIEKVLNLDEHYIDIIEQENTELKSKVDALETDNYNANCNLALITGKLEEAKKIIKGYMLFCKGETTHYKAIEKQAEQFLKE